MVIKLLRNYLLASATGAMPETKTNKMMERERTNEEKEKQTNETQISKSLNLKSKSKPISFKPISKEKERRGTPERQRGNEPAG